jgi:hypothetical protein
MKTIEEKTVKELKQYCRDNSIKGYSRKKKQELIDFINNYNNCKDNNTGKDNNNNKRKNADYQWSEFVIFIILFYHSKINQRTLRKKSNIHLIQDINIIKKIYNRNKNEIDTLNEKCEKYIDDLDKQNITDVKKIILTYTKNFYDSFDYCKKDAIFKKLETIDNKIKTIYLTGKSISIIENHDKKLYNILSVIPEKHRKGDIFLKLNNGYYCGISLKKDNKCQFTNWSIDTIMSDVANVTEQNILYKLRKDILDTISPRDIRMKLSTEEKRKLTKNLMYEKDERMDEWKKILDEFITKKYSGLFISTIIDGIAQTNKLPYRLLTFNGTKRIDNSKIRNFLEQSKISIIRDYTNFDKKKYKNIKTHYSSNAAKMWYFIVINDEIKYRFEIRSKGNWDHSPQLLIFNI